MLLAVGFVVFVIKTPNSEVSTNVDKQEELIGAVEVYNFLDEYDGMIKVHVWFSPSLKITDEIKNTSLKDLIKANKGKLSDRHQSLYEDYCDYEKALSTQYGFQWRGDVKLDYQYYSVFEKQCFYYHPTSGFEDFRRKKYLNSSGLYIPSEHLLPVCPDEETKSVPDSFNLAKVYYLQDKVSFQVNNPEYVSYIESEMEEEANMRSLQREEERKEEIARQWEEYL